METRPVEDLPLLDFETGAGEGDTNNLAGSMQIELRDEISAAHPAIDEAAMLYANGHDNAALSVLEGAIAAIDKNPGAEQMWGMLFDLYQATGKRDAFEKRALEYVVKFEKSPPTWVAATTAAKSAAAASLPLVTLTGSLNQASARQVEQLVRLAGQHRRVRVDLGKLADADNEGCKLLMAAIEGVKRAGQEIVVMNAPTLASRLERRIRDDGNAGRPFWLLLLELYQRQDMHERFEEMALEYAIKFEVSPPSWEVRPKALTLSESTARSDMPPKDEGFRIEGELTGGASEVFDALGAYARERPVVAVDLSLLRRMDFISAGSFLNTLSSLAAAGKPVRIFGVNSLVAALLGIIGVSHVAKIERRK